MDKPVTRIRGDLEKKLKVVDIETLEELRELRDCSLFATAQAQEADFKFRASLARAYRELKAPIDSSVLCLVCGAVRHVGMDRCPQCSRPVG